VLCTGSAAFAKKLRQAREAMPGMNGFIGFVGFFVALKLREGFKTFFEVLDSSL